MSSCVVEGDLRQSVDESSSSSESESDPDPEPCISRAVAAAANYDDDEEEIEVFAVGAATIVNTAPSRSEKHGGVARDPAAQDLIPSNRATTRPSGFSHQAAFASAVAARPPTPPPRGMREDKAEDPEQDADDEFDVPECIDESNKEAILLAISSGACVEEHDKPLDFTEELNVLAAQEEVVVPSIEAGGLQNMDEPLILDNPRPMQGVGINLGAAAAKALGDVLEVYGQGMGDQEVLLLDLPKEAHEATASGGQSACVGLPLDAIAEDENEEEEEEEGVGGEDERRRSERAGEVGEAAARGDRAQTADRALDEWEAAAQAHRQEVQAEAALSLDASSSDSLPPMLYSDALQGLQALDLSAFRDRVVLEDARPSRGAWGVGSILGLTRRPVALLPGCRADLEFPFLLAQLDYDPALVLHRRMLASIWLQLRAEPVPAPVDAAWELLGFQGKDPRTDLNRSMKMLSVLQICAFLQMNSVFCRQMFDLSQESGERGWPFMCVAVGFTKEALVALRGGRLNKYCNARESVLEALHLYQQACFFDFGLRLLVDPDKHHALHLSAVREASASAPTKMLKRYLKSSMVLILPEQVLSMVTSQRGDATSSLMPFDDLAEVEEVEPVPEPDEPVHGKAGRFLA